jgi:predicted nucleic acid-binding Zn ribbon protein
MNTCHNCTNKFSGRTDKKFCSLACKNQFNYNTRRETKSETLLIDRYLHRNREILDTLMGKSKKEVFDRLVVTRTGFKFEYITGIYINKEGKMYHLVYDFAWMDFSDQKVLIVRKSVSSSQKG